MLSSSKPSEKLSPKTLFDTIYRLVKARDTKALVKLIEEGYCLEVTSGTQTPISLLAQEGDVGSVKFLTKLSQNLSSVWNDVVRGYARGGYITQVNKQIRAGADRGFAMHGYAQGKHTDQVNKLIEAGEDKNDAIRGYAHAGDIVQVNELLKAGGSQSYAVLGYASGGHIDEVNKLTAAGANIDRGHAVLSYAQNGMVTDVNKQIEAGASRGHAVLGYSRAGLVAEVDALLKAGASRDMAAMGYAHGGHVMKVDELIAAGANRNSAVQGYARGGHIAQVNAQIKAGASLDAAVTGYDQRKVFTRTGLLHLVSLTDDAGLRKKLVEKAMQAIQFPDVANKDLFCKKATKLNVLIREKGLTLNQAQGYLKARAHVFLFQGQQLVKEGHLPPEMYLHLLSFITGSSNRDAEKILIVKNQAIRDGALHSLSASLFRRIVNVAGSKEKAEKIKENYYQRTSF